MGGRKDVCGSKVVQMAWAYLVCIMCSVNQCCIKETTRCARCCHLCLTSNMLHPLSICHYSNFHNVAISMCNEPSMQTYWSSSYTSPFPIFFLHRAYRDWSVFISRDCVVLRWSTNFITTSMVSNHGYKMCFFLKYWYNNDWELFWIKVSLVCMISYSWKYQVYSRKPLFLPLSPL